MDPKVVRILEKILYKLDLREMEKFHQGDCDEIVDSDSNDNRLM